MSTFETFPVLIVYRGESGISRRHIYIIAAVSAAGFWVSMSRTSKTVIASACFDTSDHGPGIPNPTRLAAPQHEGIGFASFRLHRPMLKLSELDSGLLVPARVWQ